MILGRENLGLDDEIESLKRAYLEDPDDDMRRERFEAALFRGGRSREAMLLLYPEVYKIVDEGHPEALRMMEHYDYHRSGFDADIPDSDRCMEALHLHLKANPNLSEEIKQMKKPMLQLVPVFEEGQESEGFSRLAQAMNRKPNTNAGQIDTYVSSRLDRWNYDAQVSENQGKIVGWRVAITEGAEVLPHESNPYAGEALEQQLNKTQTDYEQRKLQMVDNVQYALLQMNALSQANATSGIDAQYWTVLNDPSREGGSWVVDASWDEGRVYFLENPPDLQNFCARFRPSVVVDL